MFSVIILIRALFEKEIPYLPILFVNFVFLMETVASGSDTPNTMKRLSSLVRFVKVQFSMSISPDLNSNEI